MNILYNFENLCFVVKNNLLRYHFLFLLRQCRLHLKNESHTNKTVKSPTFFSILFIFSFGSNKLTSLRFNHKHTNTLLYSKGIFFCSTFTYFKNDD